LGAVLIYICLRKINGLWTLL